MIDWSKPIRFKKGYENYAIESVTILKVYSNNSAAIEIMYSGRGPEVYVYQWNCESLENIPEEEWIIRYQGMMGDTISISNSVFGSKELARDNARTHIKTHRMKVIRLSDGYTEDVT